MGTYDEIVVYKLPAIMDAHLCRVWLSMDAISHLLPTLGILLLHALVVIVAGLQWLGEESGRCDLTVGVSYLVLGLHLIVGSFLTSRHEDSLCRGVRCLSMASFAVDGLEIWGLGRLLLISLLPAECRGQNLLVSVGLWT